MASGTDPRQLAQLVSVLERPEEILALYKAALQRNATLAQIDRALAQGRFEAPDGNSEPLDKVNVTAPQIALIHFLATSLEAPVTVEVGYGTGLSALAFIAAGTEYDHRSHISIDPYGLEDRGGVILNVIKALVGDRFVRILEGSEYALPRLVSQGHLNNCRLSLIDGSHLFEIAMSDFAHLDRATPAGGCIVIDDAAFPAIETLVNFVSSNKRNYRVLRPFANTVVLLKLTMADGRNWYHFRPFEVPQRSDWTKGPKSENTNQR